MPKQVYDVLVVGSGASGGTLAGAPRAARRRCRRGRGRTEDRHPHRLQHPRHAVRLSAPPHPHHAARRRRLRFRAQPRRRRQDHDLERRRLAASAIAISKAAPSTAPARTGPSTTPTSRPTTKRIEREVGVCGNLDHLEDLPDGIFLPPVPMKCSDHDRASAARRSSASK